MILEQHWGMDRPCGSGAGAGAVGDRYSTLAPMERAGTTHTIHGEIGGMNIKCTEVESQ